MNGYVYILINASYHGLLKIGMTTLTPDERARQLSQPTGVPSPFMVAYFEEVPDCAAAESMIHEHLKRFRVGKRREFFQLPLRDAIRELSQIASKLRESAEIYDAEICEDEIFEWDAVCESVPGSSKSSAPNQGLMTQMMCVLWISFLAVAALIVGSAAFVLYFNDEIVWAAILCGVLAVWLSSQLLQSVNRAIG